MVLAGDLTDDKFFNSLSDAIQKAFDKAAAHIHKQHGYKPEMLTDAPVADLIGDTPKKQIFKFNPGKQMKVFPPKHPYLPKGCGNCQYKRLVFDSEKEVCKACLKVDAASVKWSREVTRQHYQKLIGEAKNITWKIDNGGVDELTVTYQDIKNVTGKPHEYAYARNMATYYLRNLLNSKNAKYLGNTPDIKGNAAHGHTDDTIWHYYEIRFLKGKSYLIIKEVNGKKYIHHIQDENHFDKNKIRNKSK